jgi:hypothetical protein
MSPGPPSRGDRKLPPRVEQSSFAPIPLATTPQESSHSFTFPLMSKRPGNPPWQVVMLPTVVSFICKESSTLHALAA